MTHSLPSDLLNVHNPWWTDPNYIPKQHAWPKRQIYSKFSSEIDGYPQIISLIGLRRTGKSTLFKQKIAELLLSGVSPKHICYFSFEEPTQPSDLKFLESLMSQVVPDPNKLDHKFYFFLDEIQYIPFWQNVIKRYYDLNNNFKFIVTGSSSLFIKQKSLESLAGRIFEHSLPPLSFLEYQKIKPTGNFSEYLKFGGFPEILDFPDPDKKIEYLKSWVITKVLEIDIPKSTGIRLQADFERLFWSLLPNAGQIISFPKLNQDLQIKRATLFRFINLLEKTLLINPVLNAAGSFRSTSKLVRKLYPASPNFLSLINPQINPGFVAETYTAQCLLSYFGKNVFLYHHRTQEIDFVIPDQKLAIEVKYQSSLHPSDYKFLQNYINQKSYSGLILTQNITQQISPNLKAIPLSSLESALKVL